MKRKLVFPFLGMICALSGQSYEVKHNTSMTKYWRITNNEKEIHQHELQLKKIQDQLKALESMKKELESLRRDIANLNQQLGQQRQMAARISPLERVTQDHSEKINKLLEQVEVNP